MYQVITQKIAINTRVIMGDYLASIRVMTKLCRVTMVTMHMMVSMMIFKSYRRE